MAFADQLKKLMAENGCKAVDLARTSGLSEAAISDYLRGKKEPRGRQSIAIAKALHVSLDTLWETEFDPRLGSQPLCLQSAAKQELALKLEHMDEAQARALLAFANALEEIEKSLRQSP
ncbi:MAG TPA: helix-turn-helix domain-containing protein [Candidatus Fimivicinus intestinavium]|nr:helix-turn-helix domain-containing protein [Candidatus Fimivicinus intestinavium]